MGRAQVRGPGDLDVMVTNEMVDPAAGSSLQEAGVEVVPAGEVQA